MSDAMNAVRGEGRGGFVSILTRSRLDPQSVLKRRVRSRSSIDRRALLPTATVAWLVLSCFATFGDSLAAQVYSSLHRVPQDASLDVDELALIPGSLMLAGPGELSAAGRSAFVKLAGGGAGEVVVLAQSRKKIAFVDWEKEGSRSAQRMVVRRAKDLARPKSLMALLNADGIWIESLTSELASAPLMRTLLVSAMKRGAVVGASGDAAIAFTGLPGTDKGRLCLAPRLHLVFGSQDPGEDDTHHKVGKANPARFVAAVPDGAAIAVFEGRRMALLGEGSIGFAVYRDESTMISERVISCKPRRDLGDPLKSRIDFLAWSRRARAAGLPLYPPEKLGTPRLRKGSLIVQGGGGVSESTWERFIELAGGKKASIACIPSANEQDNDASPSSYSARELEERGCSSLRIVHVARRAQANHDRGLIAALDSADAVWIDGGRTFRFMDRFGETEAGKALARVLKRGGVVGGSSAGCQVVGDFLVRGDPRSNSVLTEPGYLRGLGLIEGIAFDAHFRERKREAQFGKLISTHPAILGVGVDAKTALLIQGTKAEVLGKNGVNVFDRRKGRTVPDGGKKFESGDRFDLSTGLKVTAKR